MEEEETGRKKKEGGRVKAKEKKMAEGRWEGNPSLTDNYGTGERGKGVAASRGRVKEEGRERGRNGESEKGKKRGKVNRITRPSILASHLQLFMDSEGEEAASPWQPEGRGRGE